MMESNDDGSIFVLWGMSRASKRAQERRNRSSDELVMDKTVKHGWLKFPGVGHPGPGPDFRGLMSRTARDFSLQEPDVRPDGPDVRPVARMSGPKIPDRDWDFQTRLWAEFDDFGGEI